MQRQCDRIPRWRRHQFLVVRFTLLILAFSGCRSRQVLKSNTDRDAEPASYTAPMPDALSDPEAWGILSFGLLWERYTPPPSRECSDLAQKFVQLHQTMSTCERDTDCVLMPGKCDAINKNADLNLLQAAQARVFMNRTCKVTWGDCADGRAICTEGRCQRAYSGD
jgi:hypothetical protein